MYSIILERIFKQKKGRLPSFRILYYEASKYQISDRIHKTKISFSQTYLLFPPLQKYTLKLTHWKERYLNMEPFIGTHTKLINSKSFGQVKVSCPMCLGVLSQFHLLGDHIL